MYAVIFRARIRQLDEDYAATAAQMRALARDKYGCTGFSTVREGDEEIAVSYWPSMQHIHDWKHDPAHVQAQELGKTKWYETYQVQVVEILREYRNDL